jgi:hypothetical protein
MAGSSLSPCNYLRINTPSIKVLIFFVTRQLVLGILISYIPQHVKIIRHGTSAGLSPWWVLLGTISSISALANILVLPTSQHDMACGAALLGVVQIGVQWVCFMTM